MGIKVYKAYDKITDNDVLASKLSKEIEVELVCKTKGCEAKLTFVESHKRGEKFINNFMRLKPGEKHDSNCKYNTEGCINKIAGKADPNLLSEKNGDNNYRFRINLITDELLSIKDNKLDTEDSGSDNDSKKTEKIIESKKIDDYLSTMERILRLRSRVERNGNLRELITLEYKKKEISWSKFYFENDEFDRLFRYVYRAKYNKRYHPICVNSIIRRLEKPTKKWKFHKIVLSSTWQEPDENNRVVLPVVNLNTKNDNIINKINNYKRENKKFPKISSYAIFNANESDEIDYEDKKMIYNNLNGFLYSIRQFIIEKEKE